ncbi:MAG: hypothetical protein ACLRMN_04805 [Mediterraneibacter gnavus]
MIILKFPQKSGQTIEVNLGNGKQTYTVSGIMDVENDSRMFQLYVSGSICGGDGAGRAAV